MVSPDMDGREQQISLRLTGIEYAGEDTNCYRFERSNGDVLPAAPAGSHITLCLPGGLDRQYSLIVPGDAPRAYLIGVKRESGGKGGSIYVHDKLRVGQMVTVLPPRNLFQLREDAASTVLIGGGIGVTPVLAMATRLRELGRDFSFHVAFRGRAQAIMMDRIAAIPGADLHFDDEAGSFFPMEEVVKRAPRDAHLYCCGPVPMIEKFLEVAKADGRDDDFVHVEFFAAAEEAAAEGNFTVELARSKLTLEVPPGMSILNVVRDAGVSVVSSCETGVCAACETTVLEGVPDHRDAVLTASERKAGKSMMICCSGSLTKRLVLDL